MNKKNYLKIINDTGVPINAKIDKNIITFYDSRYKKGFSKLGQLISSYYTSTLLGKDKFSFSESVKGKGLNLHGGIEDWYLSKQNTIDVVNFIESNNHVL